jgi:hypothetical protein
MCAQEIEIGHDDHISQANKKIASYLEPRHELDAL